MTTRTFRPPILRRPVDVTGSSTVTTEQAVQTLFTDGYGSGFDGWYAQIAGVTIPNVVSVASLSGADTIILSEQSPRFPPYDSSRGGWPATLYALDADGMALAIWPIISVTNRTLGGQIIARAVAIGPPSRLNAQGEITGFGTNYDLTNVPVTTNTRYRMLAEITERGQDATLVSDDQGMVQIRLDDETGNVETATIRTRYLADAAIGSSVTDDLKRVWVVTGTNTIGDRRYLEFQCSRTIGGMTN